MNEMLKLVLSLSLSGGVLILALLLSRPLWKDRVSKTWQYYIWLIVIARLLLPVPTEIDLAWGNVPQTSQSTQLLQRTPAVEPSTRGAVNDSARGDGLGDGVAAQEENPVPEVIKGNIGLWFLDKLWLLWLSVALLLFLQRVVTYCRFSAHIQRGWEAVKHPALLGTLAQAKAKAGVNCPVKLYRNPMVSSPLLLGFFRPIVVLPNTDLPQMELYYTLLHELTHYKRGDMFYKWLVQLTLCLHWFNPLVWWMAREINRDGELSCDEALLRRLDAPARRDYGDTLLHAVAAGESGSKPAGTVYLNTSAQCLKERLGAIMKFGKKKYVTIPLLLTLLLACGAVVMGAYVHTEPSMQQSGQLWYFQNSYYLFGEGATEADIPPVWMEEFPNLVLVEKDKSVVVGDPSVFFSEDMAAAVKTQCQELVKDGALTRGEMRLAVKAAEELQQRWEAHATQEETQQEPVVTYMESVEIGYPEQTGPYLTSDGYHQGPYLFTLAWNISGGEGQPSETFTVWDETEQNNVTLTAYFNEDSEKMRQDLVAMQALSDQMYAIYTQRKETGEQAVDFYVSVADYIGDTGPEALAEQYFERYQMTEFEALFPMLDETTHREWLERAYARGDKTSFATVFNCLNADDELLERFAQRAYTDNKLEVFEALTWSMDRETVERWLDKTRQDGRNLFSLLLLESLRYAQ